ncbi:MAG: DisA bacterial checkpoint controller nucleotide-binding protein [Bacteroidetes bacterium ADurb.Bin037]|nr:MAG: DisA bacterial checkpoint controller nucleotide-binding protein [Bacteroidetes bacterium ADurb.Bin037]
MLNKNVYLHTMPDFLRLDIIDIIDIVLVGLLIYQVYKIIRGSAAVSIFLGILFVYFIWLVVKALHMELLTTILDKVISVGVLALIVVFQQEIRRFLLRLGSRYTKERGRRGLWKNLFYPGQESLSKSEMEEIINACSRMSERKTGALIAVERMASLGFITETGDRIEARVHRRLIENVFFRNSPLHDGGMVIANGRIQAARCTFPMSDSQGIPPYFGMRHRAGIGLSEQTDAFVIVVSEETGDISTMQDGVIKTLSGVAELRLDLENAFHK